MAYPVRYFLTRRVLVAGALAALASPALANIGPELLQGTLAKFQLAKQPKALPELAFADADDKPLRLADYKGRIVLLNFWATWCAPCRQEIPQFVAAYERFRNEGLLVLAVNMQEGKSIARGYAEDFGMKFPIPIDVDGEVRQHLSVAT